MANCFKSFDRFGQPVGLHFRNEGKTINTCCGGFASLIINLAVLLFTANQLRLMVQKSELTYSII